MTPSLRDALSTIRSLADEAEAASELRRDVAALSAERNEWKKLAIELGATAQVIRDPDRK